MPTEVMLEELTIERVTVPEGEVPSTDAVLCKFMPPEGDELFDTEVGTK